MSRHTKRDEKSGKFEGEVTEQEILKALSHSSEPVLTAKEVSEELPIGSDAVTYRLKKMHEDGLVGRKEIGARAVAWWAKVEPILDDEHKDVEEMTAGDFRGVLHSDKSDSEPLKESREKDREREKRLMKVARGELDEDDE